MTVERLEREFTAEFRLLWFMVFVLAILIALAFACLFAEKAHASDDFQKAKFIDCQSIQTDERFLKLPNTTRLERLICFWGVQVEGRDLVMWQEVGTGKFGFVEGR